MGYLNFSIPKNLIQKIHQHIPFDNFVETGTYQGGSCFWAASIIKNVFTIEIDAEISKNTAARLDCPENIKFFIGDSRFVLPEIVNSVSGRTLFWLDGHWCPGAGGKENECPILEEINAIKTLPDAVIFIDDARLFMGPPTYHHDAAHWPRIDTIFAELKACFPNHSTTIQDDVIMCFPQDLATVIDEDWVDKYDARFTLNDKDEITKSRLYPKIAGKIKRFLK
jgi:hypothetical protein